jgi:signal transduction protein with GAF and PtsI domain
MISVPVTATPFYVQVLYTAIDMSTEEREDEILGDLEKLRCKCNNATTQQEEDEILERERKGLEEEPEKVQCELQNEDMVGFYNDTAEIERDVTKFVNALESARTDIEDYIEGFSGATRLQKKRVIQWNDDYQTLRMLIADSQAQILWLGVLEEKVKTGWKQMKKSSMLQRSAFLEKRCDEVYDLRNTFAKQAEDLVNKLADSDDEWRESDVSMIVEWQGGIE